MLKSNRDVGDDDQRRRRDHADERRRRGSRPTRRRKEDVEGEVDVEAVRRRRPRTGDCGRQEEAELQVPTQQRGRRPAAEGRREGQQRLGLDEHRRRREKGDQVSVGVDVVAVVVQDQEAAAAVLPLALEVSSRNSKLPY